MLDKIDGLANCGVMVVEDEFLIADDLRKAVTELGGTLIGPVPSREQAMQLLSATADIDIAVLDINLGGEEAYAIADALMDRDIPFVFATGYDKASIPERYRHAPLWEKPFDAVALARTLPAQMRRA